MRDFMKMTGQSISDIRQSTMVNTQAISKLEMQMGQLANHLGERDKGKFPSQAVNNPKACGNSSNQEHVQAIVTLRSGKRVDNKVVNPEENAEEEEQKGEGKQREEEGDNQEEGDAEPSTVTPVVKEPPRALVPKAPYPERLQAPRNGGKIRGHSGGVQTSPNKHPIFGRHPANPFLCQVLEGLGHSEEENECP
jgi:hypothetical protein